MANIVLINDEGVEVFNSWAQVKKRTSFKKEDFIKHGTDYVANVTEDSFEISKDIKLLEHVAAKKMFTKNKFEFSDLISIITLGLVFISLVN